VQAQVGRTGKAVAKKRPNYLSYLLRLWRANGPAGDQDDGAAPAWRASLESPRTRERRSFRSLDEMVAYLRREIDAAEADDHEDAA
jgi:hypothetical protein